MEYLFPFAKKGQRHFMGWKREYAKDGLLYLCVVILSILRKRCVKACLKIRLVKFTF